MPGYCPAPTGSAAGLNERFRCYAAIGEAAHWGQYWADLRHSPSVTFISLRRPMMRRHNRRETANSRQSSGEASPSAHVQKAVHRRLITPL